MNAKACRVPKWYGKLSLAVLLWNVAATSLFAEAIEIKGANGRVIAFDGIREAVPQGLWLRVQPGGDEVAVAWSKLDVESLRTDHPAIYAAWEAAQKGESTLLELGSYERELANLNIAEAIEKVTEHADAASSLRAESLSVLPYLYNTGGDEHPMPFRFHAPDIEYRAGDVKIPLVVWLHGAGSGGTDNGKNANLNLAEKILDPAGPCEGKCFMLFPQYHDEYNWWSYTSDKRGQCAGIPGRQTLDLIDELVAEIPAVDGDRIYIMGMSQGGFGIPYLVTAYPNRFAAQILVAGMTYSVPWSAQNAIPSWLYYSKDDPVMNQNGNDIGAEMTGVLEGVASDEMIKVTIYDDAGHGGTLKRAIDEGEWLPWLFQQKNENEPKRDSGLMDAHFN